MIKKIKAYVRAARSTVEDAEIRIADDDGDTSGDEDVCARCDCLRFLHDDGGECSACGDCRKFKEGA